MLTGCHDRAMGERAVRWAPPALVLVLLGWIAARAARPISDPDDWWHLRLGNDLIAQHSLATPAHWSVFATVDWVPTEPLPEIVAAYVDRWFGLPGLAVLFAVAGMVVVLTVYLTCRSWAAPLPSALATVLTVLAASASLTSRPQLISFVLFPIVISAWLRTEQDHRVRWWLVPLVWLWSLCHGFWFLGAGYGVLFVVGFALSRSMSRPVLLRQGALAIGSFAVVALNPVGLGVLEAPLAVNSTAQYIAEWARTDLTSPAALGSLAMVAVTAGLWVATRHGATWPRVLVLVSAVVWTWYSGRTVAVAGLVVAPLFAAALDRLVRAGNGESAEASAGEGPGRSEMAVLAAAAAVAVIVVAALAPSTSDRPGDVPTRLDATLDRLPAGTRVFNAYELGGWIAWRHPDLEQYIDGLITPYSERHAHDYTIAESTSRGWYDVVLESHAAVALVARNSALAGGLENKGWTQEGQDEGYVLLREPRNS
jgi:hypothetical protein